MTTHGFGFVAPVTVNDARIGVAALDAEYGAKVECILYGGSVNQGNAEETLQVKGVNGLFVGRSAWQVDGYLELLKIAAARV